MRRRFMSQSDYLQPMYFEAVEDGLTISLPSYDIEYRIGIDGEWQTLSAGEFTPSINSGTKIFFKKESKGNLGSFLTNAGFRLGGDCRSLLHGEKVTKDSPLYGRCFDGLFANSLLVGVEDNILPSTQLVEFCYIDMFNGCTSLVNAPELPATTLANYCYSNMFNGCTSLVNAPELPATTLANSCYFSMFRGCTSLTIAPELPAIVLKSSCYSLMFYGCSNLQYIKALFTTTPGSSYTNLWLSNVSPTGTFVKSKDATWDVVGDDGVPTGWTVITDEEESGGKTVNTGRFVEHSLGSMYLEWDYPVTSDINITVTTSIGASLLVKTQKGENRSINSATIGPGEFITEVSFSPLEDDTYIYVIE